MLRVLTVSSQNERANADRLAQLIRDAWPGIFSTQTERVTVAAGLKLVRESDVLVTFDFDEPRRLEPQTLRDGTTWPGGDVQAGAIVIECKALDRSRLISVGNDLRPVYGVKPAYHTVLEQLKSQIDGIVSVLERYGRERCFIHGLAWMRGVTGAELLEQAPAISPFILGSDATWVEMLAAAAQEHASIANPAGESYRSAVRFATERLTRERRLSARDAAKLDRFTTETVARDVAGDVMAKLGTHNVRLVGGPGSGKSTTLALVAKRVVERDAARVLFLTYHHVLRSELEHLVGSILGPAGTSGEHIVVSTLHDFLLPFFAELGGDVPLAADGRTDYAALPAAIAAFLGSRPTDELRKDADALRELLPLEYNFDYAFVDEAQDWRPELRDLLFLLFPSASMVLADGRRSVRSASVALRLDARRPEEGAIRQQPQSFAAHVGERRRICNRIRASDGIQRLARRHAPGSHRRPSRSSCKCAGSTALRAPVRNHQGSGRIDRRLPHRRTAHAGRNSDGIRHAKIGGILKTLRMDAGMRATIESA